MPAGCVHCVQCEEFRTRVEVIQTIVTRLDKELLGEGSGGRMAAHDARLGKLERWRSRMNGALAVIAALFTGLLTVGGALLARKH